jgi:CRISPR/Cas system CSM-associated protein Csm3 (group 7 of RAMP superfamily)
MAQTARRSHVAIDRFTGGVGEGPFLEELAPPGQTLTTTLRIENFALWQLGLLALVAQELTRGYVGVGGGTRKGQGQVQLTWAGATFSYDARLYGNSTGIVSAQARLATPPWNAADVPPAVQTVEAELVLLGDLAPQPGAGWRDSGLVRVRVPDARVNELLVAAVRQAWVPWVAQQIEEAPR